MTRHKFQIFFLRTITGKTALPVILSLCLMCVHATAQQIYDDDGPALRNSSRIVYNGIDLPYGNIDTTDKVFDFGNLQRTRNDYAINVSADSCNTYTCTFDNIIRKYQRREDFFMLLSEENRLAKINYHTGLKSVFCRQETDAVSEGNFEGYGTYCEKQYIRVNGHSVLSSGKGKTLILPGNDTLKNVTLQHLHTISVLSAGTDSVLTDTASSKKLTEDTYCWYAKDMEYPILAVHLSGSYSGCTLAGETAKAFILPLDECRLIANQYSKDTRKNISTGFASCEESDKDLPYNVHVAGRHIVITFGYTPQHNLAVTLSDSSGIVYKSAGLNDISDKGEIHIDSSGLRRGQYILRLNDGTKTYRTTLSI